MPPPTNGRPLPFNQRPALFRFDKDTDMHNIIYLVGLVVVVIAILSFLGLA
ncbi:hypothetical protein [Roseibium sp. LAB1]